MECGTKIQHPTRDAALDHIKALVYQNHVRGQSDRSKGLAAYPCDRCGHWHVGHEPSAPPVYHYTLMDNLDAILEADELRPPESRAHRVTRKMVRHLSPEEQRVMFDLNEDCPLLWFSRNPIWEYSVIKTRRPSHVSPNVPFHPEDKMHAKRSELELIGNGLVRFVVPASVAKLRWSDYLALNRTSRDLRDGMAKYGNPVEWLATNDPLPLDMVRAIEVYFGGVWVSVNDVSDELFDRYITERPRVYDAAAFLLNQKMEKMKAELDAGVPESSIEFFVDSDAEQILLEDNFPSYRRATVTHREEEARRDKMMMA